MSFQLGFIRHMRKNSQMAWSLMRHQDKCKLSAPRYSLGMRHSLCALMQESRSGGWRFCLVLGLIYIPAAERAGLWLQEDLDSYNLRNG